MPVADLEDVVQVAMATTEHAAAIKSHFKTCVEVLDSTQDIGHSLVYPVSSTDKSADPPLSELLQLNPLEVPDANSLQELQHSYLFLLSTWRRMSYRMIQKYREGFTFCQST